MVAPVISRLVPVPRNQGVQVPAALPAASWCDSKALAGGVAESYTIPVDVNGNRGTLLGINAETGPLYYSFNGTAVVPTADVTNGTSSIMLRTDTGSPFLISVPNWAYTLSLISAAANIVTIEVWS